MGIEINEITTILAEDSFNETDITCQLIVWFDILIVFHHQEFPQESITTITKVTKKSLNMPSLFAQYEQWAFFMYQSTYETLENSANLGVCGGSICCFLEAFGPPI